MSHFLINQHNGSVLKFRKLTENAYTPTRATAVSAGYDLFSSYDATIHLKAKAIISLSTP